MQPSIEQPIRVTARLYETRAVVRRHLGARYATRIAEYTGVIQRVSDKTGESLMSTATAIAKTADAEGETDAAMMILAAVVEMLDPTPAVPA